MGRFGTSVTAGRDFAPLDFENGHALIVNESFSRYVFGGRNGIGRRIRIGSDVRTQASAPITMKGHVSLVTFNVRRALRAKRSPIAASMP